MAALAELCLGTLVPRVWGFFPSLAGYGSNEYSGKYFFTWKVSDENLLAVSDSGCGNEHP